MGNTAMVRPRFHVSVNGTLTMAPMCDPPSAENSQNSMIEFGKVAGGSRAPAVVSNWNLNFEERGAVEHGSRL